MHPLDAPPDGTRLTPAVHSALANAYAFESTDGGFWLYRPRPG